MPGFTDRNDELARLAGLAHDGRVVVTAIGGTAGVGKTALAVHAAHQMLAKFPDGHLYADLRGYTEGQDPAQPGEVLALFLRSLGVPAEEVPVDGDGRSGMLRQLLASRRVLMVLDNARNEAQVRPLLPGAGRALVVVTSRSVLPGLEVDERISLDVLAEDEAAAMLAGLAGPRATGDPAAVAEVARLCGRLPLALRIAGQLLAAHPAWSIGRLRLVQMLAGERGRLAELGASELPVRAAFEVSYRQLPKQDARLFRLLGLHPGPDFDVPAAEALAGTEADVAGPALGRLAEAYLVTEDATGRFGMHDLLRLFARDTCGETDSPAVREAAEMRLVGYYARLAGFLDACLDPRLRPALAEATEQAGGSLPTPRDALAVFEAERPNLLAALGLAAQRGWEEQVCQLSENMGDSLGLLRYLGDLLTAGEAALAAARRTANTGAEGRALGNLGVAYWELRRLEEAVTCYHDSLAIFRETGDRPGEGHALGNLGNAYLQLGRSEEAIICCQDSLVICRETGDLNGEGEVLNNLGLAYWQLQRPEEAVTCYQDSLVISRETGNRHLESEALGNLGNAYRQLGRPEEAITCYQDSLVICRKTGDRHGEGQTLDNLAIAYQEMRQVGRAATCWREAAAAMRDVGDHEKAARLEQLVANTKPRRRWWVLHRRSPS